MNNTWIQVLLNYANGKTVNTKAKPCNRPTFWKKPKPQQNPKLSHYHINGQKDYIAWSASGMAIPTFFENLHARTPENHSRKGITARTKK